MLVAYPPRGHTRRELSYEVHPKQSKAHNYFFASVNHSIIQEGLFVYKTSKKYKDLSLMTSETIKVALCERRKVNWNYFLGFSCNHKDSSPLKGIVSWVEISSKSQIIWLLVQKIRLVSMLQILCLVRPQIGRQKPVSYNARKRNPGFPSRPLLA